MSLRLIPTKQQTSINPDGSITVFVPFTFKHTAGRKMIMTPSQPPNRFADPKVRTSLLNGVLRAYKWLEMLESGKVKTAKEISKKEKIAHTYISTLLKVTILAPDIIEAILNGTQPAHLTLDDCTKPMPRDWASQRRQLGFTVA